jgi:hypothetical protein
MWRLFSVLATVASSAQPNLIRDSSSAVLAAETSVQEAENWLQSHKPQDGVNSSFLMQHAREAAQIREANAWAKEVPADLYHDFVLPYTHFDERPELWRGFFHAKLAPIVSNSQSLREAATAVTQGIWTAFGEPAIHFKSNSTPEVLSPMHDLLVKRYASCTGMSIFLADGLRSVGVPARVVGTTLWNRPSGGNHNWVEAWFDSKWNFIDSNPGQKWNEAWFQDDAKKAIPGGMHGIYTPIWDSKKADGKYVVGWRDNLTLPAIELTKSYQSVGSSPAGSHENFT